jgi:hypothetical protein
MIHSHLRLGIPTVPYTVTTVYITPIYGCQPAVTVTVKMAPEALTVRYGGFYGQYDRIRSYMCAINKLKINRMLQLQKHVFVSFTVPGDVFELQTRVIVQPHHNLDSFLFKIIGRANR